MRLKALAGVLLLSWSAAALAQAPAAPAPSPFKFEFHGIAAGTISVQDGLGNNGTGQGPYFAVTQGDEDRLSFTGDVRESRFNWSLAGPAVFGGAIPKAVVEIDWAGGFGAGPAGDVHLVPRLRVAYAELNWGAHRILFGQNYDLTGGVSPVTLAKLANPPHLAAGNLGFRRPGVFGYHTFGDVKSPSASRLEFAWEIGRSAWNDNPGTNNSGNALAANVGAQGCALSDFTAGSTAPQPAANTLCPGEASGLPAVEARLTYLMGQSFTAFVAGHYARVDRNGFNVVDPSTGPLAARALDQISGIVGTKIAYGPLTFAGSVWYGKNAATQTATIGGQFTAAGDVREIGAWGQLGYNLSKELSLWAFAGVDRPDPKDAVQAGFTRLRNVTTAGMIQYRDGGYAIGLEYFHFHTNYVSVAAAAAQGNKGGIDAADLNQIALTGAYFF